MSLIQGHPELEAKNTDLRAGVEETLTFHLSGETARWMGVDGPWHW